MEQQPCHLRLLTMWVLPIQTHSLLTPTTKRLFESIVQCPADIPLEHDPVSPPRSICLLHYGTQELEVLRPPGTHRGILQTRLCSSSRHGRESTHTLHLTEPN